MKKRSIRNLQFNQKLLIFLFIVVLIVAAIWIGQNTYLVNFTKDQQLTLCFLLFAVYLWIAVPIPNGASSLLLIAMMILLNLVDTVEEALAGFLSPALYFILVLSIISNALVKAEVDRVIARLLIKISKSGPKIIIIGLPIAILFMPIILPSAVARFKMLLPLMDSMNKLYGYSEKSIFHKYSIFLIGMMNQNATMVVFTGGGFPVLAYQLLIDYNVTNIGWIDWFLLISIPLWIGSIIMVVFIWNYLKLMNPNEQIVSSSPVIVEEKRETLPVKFWIVLLSFLAMVITWIITDEAHVPLLLPPLLLVALYAMPKLGLVTNKTIRDYDWENFLMLGASFSLGMLLANNGTADAIANLLIGIIPEDAGMVFKVIIIALIIFVLRFFFIVPSSAIVVIFPIVMSYSEIIGIPQVQLAFLVIFIIGSMMILPIHSTTTYLAFERGVVSKKEQYVVGFVFSFFFMFVAIFSVFYYW